jgi:hypothetical protein
MLTALRNFCLPFGQGKILASNAHFINNKKQSKDYSRYRLALVEIFRKERKVLAGDFRMMMPLKKKIRSKMIATISSRSRLPMQELS